MGAAFFPTSDFPRAAMVGESKINTAGAPLIWPAGETALQTFFGLIRRESKECRKLPPRRVIAAAQARSKPGVVPGLTGS